MKRALLSLAATLAATTLAGAADLPVAPPPPPPPPLASWTGLYVGAFGGAILDDSRTLLFPTGDFLAPGFAVTNPLRTEAFRHRGTEGIGGGLGGFNYQFGNIFQSAAIVVGVEADGGSGITRDRFLNVPVLPTPLVGSFTGPVSTKLDYLGTVRGRLGLAFGDVLLYGTGGFAYSHTSIQTNVAFSSAGDRYLTNVGRDVTGYAYGGGIEYRLTPNVLVRAEYLHYDLGRFQAVSAPAAGGGNFTYTSRLRNEVDVVRGAISYKFSTPWF